MRLSDVILQMNHKIEKTNSLIIFKLSLTFEYDIVLNFVAGYACDFPTNWRDKAFRDSTNSSVKENIYFYRDSVVWSTSIYSTNVVLWDCHDISTEEVVIKG
jgi:hypothetical protein